MLWKFECGQWEAESHRKDENDSSLYWRIDMCEDGTFAVNGSDYELTEHKGFFGTLDDAKAFCEGLEGNVIVSSTDQIQRLVNPMMKPHCIIIDDPQQKPGCCQPGVGQWFSKTLEERGLK